MCLYGKLVKNPKYTVNKKNQGEVPILYDERMSMVPIGCQKCMECRKQKSNEWRVRCSEELRSNPKASMVTLTFDTKSLIKLGVDLDPELNGYDRDIAICALAVKMFRERWRKNVKNGAIKKKLKYWLIPEIGGGRYEHVHMHGIIFHDNWELIKRMWGYGWIYFGDKGVGDKTINYTMKYLSKPDPKHRNFKPRVFVSDGLGSGWFDRSDKDKNVYKPNGMTDESYTFRDGWKTSLPIYYRNKIWTDEEREMLWYEKLLEDSRWVDGKEIKNVSEPEGEALYKKVLEEAREKNKRLGYGGEPLDDETKQYEEAKRSRIMADRLKDYYIRHGYKPNTRLLNQFEVLARENKKETINN